MLQYWWAYASFEKERPEKKLNSDFTECYQVLRTVSGTMVDTQGMSNLRV
jgi:hypothetical protein